MHRVVGSVGLSGTLLGAISGPISGDSLFFLVAAVVFAFATWRSRAPGLLRQDNSALASRLKTRERELEEEKTAHSKLAGRLESAEAVVAELRAKDTAAIYDLMAAHDTRATETMSKLTSTLEALAIGQRTLEEAIKIIATGALADVRHRA